ncbi:MAG: 5-oxoprolinase subunit PxpA [Luteolibacter sp.]|uniref:5-oxoprolinase subunit PxpA n=1 Tax=Luteolibacter sp. TaxID=1962973 RepID=UPI003266D799
MREIDLNADLGEGGGEDAALLGLVSSANIACGGHAGDEETMRRTIDLAMASGVAIGAHPGYEDREHFGRRAMSFPLDRVTDLVARQVEKLAKLAEAAGAPLHHVKPHGALYNQADRDALFAAAVVAGITKISPRAMLYALPNSRLAEAGQAVGLTICPEGFADRRYLANGSLMPRNEPGAVIKDVDEAVARAIGLAGSGNVETLCVHGDGPTAVAILRRLRNELEADGLKIHSKPRA